MSKKVNDGEEESGATLSGQEAVAQAKQKWKEARQFASSGRWEAAVKAGDRALGLIDEQDDGLYGDWSREMLEWRARSGDVDALKQASTALVMGRLLPKKTIFFVLILLVVFSMPLFWVMLKGGNFRNLFSSTPPTMVSRLLDDIAKDTSPEQKNFLTALKALKKHKDRRVVEAALAKKLATADGASACRLLEATYLLRKNPSKKFVDISTPLRLTTPKLVFQRLDCRKNLNLRNIRLLHTRFIKASLYKANLHNAQLTHVDLRYARIREANLRLARISQSNLRHIDLQGTSLQHAILQKTDFRGAQLQNADLSQTNLLGSLFDEKQLPTLKAAKATLSNAHCLANQPEPNHTQSPASLCYHWHAFPKQRSGQRPKPCPKALSGPIISLSSPKAQGTCPWQLQKLNTFPNRLQPNLLHRTTVNPQLAPPHTPR